MENDIPEKYDPCEDDEFLNELDRRTQDLENGKTEEIPGKEAQQKLKDSKLTSMKQASTDPLFLADLKKIKDDFDALDR